MKTRYLKPIKRGQNKQPNFSVFDIEARDWTNFIVAGYYNGSEFQYFNSLDRLLHHVFRRGDREVFAHFGGHYDFQFIMQAVLTRENSSYSLGELIPRGSGMLSLEVLDEYGERVVFRDSSAILPFSLKRLTENFGVDHKKQEFDYSKIVKITPKLIEYLEYDCKGLYESIQKFYQWPLIKKSGPAYTIAGQALKVFRTTLYEPLPALAKQYDQFVRESYFGGRTEIFNPIYEGPGPLYCYDVNSLYPHIMRNTPMPGQCIGFTKKYTPSKIGFYEAIATVPKSLTIPPLPVKHNNKLIFPTGTFRGKWSDLEIRYAESLGCTFKIIRGCLFESRGLIFSSYIDQLYKIKEEATSGSVDYMLSKLLMNSCYGRFGLRMQKETLEFDDGYTKGTQHKILTYGGHNYRLMRVSKELESYTHVGIAAYVTSAARVHMHKYYMQCGKELYYSDTDSLYTTKQFESDPKKLGALKLEEVRKEGCFLLPKTYLVAGKEEKNAKIEETKVVMKGFDKKKIQHFTFEDFKVALEGDLKHLKIVVAPRFAKIKTALQMEKLLTMTKESTKSIQSVYDKRIIFKENGKYSTRPIHIANEEPKNEKELPKKKEIRRTDPIRFGGKKYRRKTGRTKKDHNSQLSGRH